MLGPPQTEDFGALIVRIGGDRDRDAFARVFAFYGPKVKSYLQRLGASPAAAEDLAQDTMVAVWRKAASYDPAKAGAGTWIFTIARNLRIDALRRERHPDELIWAITEPEPEPQPDAALARVEADRLLDRALATLPVEQADVIRLAYFSDQPHSAIERALGIPLGTVKSRLRLALARLRAQLDGTEP